MIKRFLSLLVLCPLPLIACQWQPDDLIGSYRSLGHSYFDTFALEREGIFHSWLHQRPAITAKWQLDKNCILVIRSEHLTHPIKLTLIALTANKAVFSDGQTKQHYQRLSAQQKTAK